ncbi:MAG: nucleotidyltransferase domain-containing protein [Myxococcales bacterium]|nr:nucleotidyltransferase domain-containing protein [Myxococcales bacterium]
MTLPLSKHQHRIAERVLDEESVARHHVVIALTGAHAYGFPSPDSDLDLKAVHVLPTRRFVGLARPDEHANRAEIVEGVEIDYGSNEIGQVLAGLLRGYGSYLERIFGMWTIRAAPELEELRALARGALSRRVHAHYHGFATGQLKAATEASAPTAKKLLYVLRTGLTGTHLLLTGEVVTDLTVLMDEHGFGEARELLEIKRSGERASLPGEVAERWLARAARVFELLESARGRSVLPEEPSNRDAIEAWLVALRRIRFD